jgi:hypothetical protein
MKKFVIAVALAAASLTACAGTPTATVTVTETAAPVPDAPVYTEEPFTLEYMERLWQYSNDDDRTGVCASFIMTPEDAWAGFDTKQRSIQPPPYITIDQFYDFFNRKCGVSNE